MKRAGAFAFAGLLALGAGSACAQAVYKSVGKDGKVTYSSAPPAAAARPIATRSYSMSWEHPEVAAVRSEYDRGHAYSGYSAPPVVVVPRTPTVLSGDSPQNIPWTGPAWRRGAYEPNLPPAPPVDSTRRYYYGGR